MELEDRRILVTGGAGFIGSHLSRRLLELGAGVDIVDNLSTGKASNVPEGAAFHYLDLALPQFTRVLPKGPFDAVCHLAAQPSGEASHEDPTYDLLVNAGATPLLVRWCQEKGVPRFLYASSMAVYGEVETAPVAEEHPCRPVSYYGISKLASEHYLRLAQSAGLSTTTFRMFSVYGPGQNLDNLRQGMVSIYLAYLLKGEPITVKGSLTRMRDFVHVEDVVEAWVQALIEPIADGKTYNQGSGVPTTVGALLDHLATAFGHLPQSYPIQEEAPTLGDQFAVCADISRIQADLGWRPRIELPEGLASMVAWAKALPHSEEALTTGN